jgi:hypothetical protein
MEMSRYFRVLLSLVVVMLVGCATATDPVTSKTASSTGVADITAEPARQYMCVSAVYVSEATRAQTLTQGSTVAPIGEWLARQLDARFWMDAALRTTGRPQPRIAAGFAPGTGVRPAGGLGGNVEAQVVLQFQVMKPTGQAYYETVGGRSTADSVDQASARALMQALDGMETMLAAAGLCSRVL